MGKSILAGLSLASAIAYSAPVPVSDVKWSQDVSSHVVTVTYTLESDAIVTVEALTNGVPLKGITHLAGDVCRMVKQGDRSFRWAVECSHPDISALPEDSEIRVLAWKKSDPPDYLVASLAVTNDIAYYPDESSLPLGIGSDHYRRGALVMRRIRARNRIWRMGAPAKEKGVNQWSAEHPHLVMLSSDYYIGVFEVTQGQTRSLLGYEPSCHFKGDVKDFLSRPQDSVSYDQIRGTVEGAKWPNADYATAHGVDSTSLMQRFRNITGFSNLDLPSEAQWEFACRAGSTSGLYTGLDVSDTDRCPCVDKIARYSNTGGKYNDGAVHSSTGGTARVGSYLPNAWGLYDMLGNVREWCLDWLGDYSGENVSDPSGPGTGAARCVRGGGYTDAAYICRAGNRGSSASKNIWVTLGFRLAMDIIPGNEDENGSQEVE